VPLSAEMLPSPKRMSNNRVSIEQVVSPARVHKVMDLIGMSVRQNVMTGDFESRFEAEGVTGFFFKEEDSGKAIGGLVHACSRCGLKGPEQIKQIVVSRARDNRFSPVGEWIKSKPWDGRSRIQELCDTLIMRNRAQIITAPAPAGGGADTSAVPPTASEDAALAALAAVNRWRDLVVPLWLKQTVAAIRNWENEVPTSVGHVLVLQGPKQGGNKSFWIEALLPAPWVSIGMSLRLDGPNERDAVSRVTSTPITELGELDHSFKRSETGALKNFLTAPKDRYRPPYATKDETKPRGTSFIATLNPEGFLVDPTGPGASGRWG
jgi:putative DNA primase/helicase